MDELFKTIEAMTNKGYYVALQPQREQQEYPMEVVFGKARELGFGGAYCGFDSSKPERATAWLNDMDERVQAGDL